MTDQPLSPCRTMTKSAGLAPSCIIRAILVESDERFGQVVGLGHGAPPSVSAQRWCLRPRRSPHSFFFRRLDALAVNDRGGWTGFPAFPLTNLHHQMMADRFPHALIDEPPKIAVNRR